MGYDREVEEAYKVWLCLAGLGLIGAWRFVPRHYATSALAALTVLAGLNYWRGDLSNATDKIDAYDLMHYYVNAKYWDELGYADLYPAALLADLEDGGPAFNPGPNYMQQGNGPDAIRPVAEAIARGRIVKAERFTDARWAAFSHDVLYLERDRPEMTEGLWRQMIQDHGYNGAPAWTAIARPLTSLVPVEQVKWLCQLDVALLLVALGVVAWVYGADTALWAAFFLMVTYSTRWPVIGWALLRYDYVAALLLAMCALKRGEAALDGEKNRYYALAGAFAAWSATLRIFPAAWMFGPFAKGVLGLLEKRVSKPLLALAGGFLLAAAALEGFSAATLGAGVITDHIADMRQHTAPSQLSSRRVGLALALPFRGETLPKNISKARKAEVEAQTPMRLGVGAVGLLLLGAGMRKTRDDEAFAWGFLPFFLFTTASYYYYVTRITLIVAHAGQLDKPRHLVGLAALIGLELFCNQAETALPEHRVFLVGYLAWGIAAYGLVMAAWMTYESWRAAPQPPG